MPTPSGNKQPCPFCGQMVDVSAYVTGQRARCRCGMGFIVRRQAVPQAETATIPEEPSERTTDPAHFSATPGDPSGVQIQRLAGSKTPPPRQPPAAPPPLREQPAAQHSPAVTKPAAALPVFEGYSLVERLGQGGMGEVWKARRKSDGLLVAIKVLAEQYANDKSLVLRFEKEVAALATLDHPGIVKLVGHDFKRRPPFFAMELCDGETLRERMSKASFSLADRLGSFVDLCRILSHAHERGVVHRDLKPDNVLFDAHGNLKLIDFGLASLADGDPRYQLTQAAMTMGTADYMPPEQRTDARSVDARGDVWSLGIMLYELMAGTLPVGNFKPLTERMPGLDPRIDQVIRSALIHDREKRLQSAAEMAQAIDAIRQDLLHPPKAPTPKSSFSDKFLGFFKQPKKK